MNARLGLIALCSRRRLRSGLWEKQWFRSWTLPDRVFIDFWKLAPRICSRLDSLRGIKSEYDAYEDVVFGKIKEGVLIASEHPLITCGVASGLGLVALKRKIFALNFATRNVMSMGARADSKVKALKQYVDLLKAEGEKLEKSAVQAEKEIRRGPTKLRQAGRQIQGVIRSAYKIERKAAGLKDECGELPSREASRFKSQVSKLASEAKRERNAFDKGGHKNKQLRNLSLINSMYI